VKNSANRNGIKKLTIQIQGGGSPTSRLCRNFTKKAARKTPQKEPRKSIPQKKFRKTKGDQTCNQSTKQFKRTLIMRRTNLTTNITI
jgi:hypothetical protein